MAAVRAKIKLEGVVQGVGFRPFVHRLSRAHELAGFTANTSRGVEIEVEGEKSRILRFNADLAKKLPPLARITNHSISFAPPKNYRGFTIRESRASTDTRALVSPDIGTCDRCRKELSDPGDRRFLYPFINCTDCGPRFSIIEGLPYDRPATTMKEFAMCPRCRREYESLDDRRYHAQPNACPVCGPGVELLESGKKISGGNAAVGQAVRLLRAGKIVAVKGISEFHIACDALNPSSVRRLRERKRRPHKPFAVMAADDSTIRKFCRLSPLEKQLIFSPERPIVLLRKLPGSPLRLLSPDNNYLGVMAPYSPLHYLLSGQVPLMVMTSGNEADEPVETDNGAAQARLEGVCDYFLTHNRKIANPCDDSLIQVMAGKAVMLRRGRGYSPFPFLLDEPARRILACGAELKNTFCLCKGRSAFLSQYIGDLKTFRTFSFYGKTIDRLCRLFRAQPRILAHDLHPDYLSTKYALGVKKENPRMRLVPVQHHRAHIASVIAEHNLKRRVIGVCFDGSGYGDDRTVWGGEFFAGSLKKMRRVASLGCVAMPGGDSAVREPYRMGMSFLYDAFGESLAGLDIGFIARHREKIPPLLQLIRSTSVRTSSCGRLFDAVSAVLGICDIISYEAQAAVRLQALAEKSASKAAYRLEVGDGMPLRVGTRAMFRELAADIGRGVDAGTCARKFHNGLCQAAAQVCGKIRRSTGIGVVCLSGGVFQNRLLLENLKALLTKKKFTVFHNQLVPGNDGAVSLGQAVIANELCA